MKSFTPIFIIIACIFSACSTNNSTPANAVIPLVDNDLLLVKNVYTACMLSSEMAQEANTRSTTFEAKKFSDMVATNYKASMNDMEVVAGKHNA